MSGRTRWPCSWPPARRSRRTACDPCLAAAQLTAVSQGRSTPLRILGSGGEPTAILPRGDRLLVTTESEGLLVADVDCDDTDPAINPAAPDLPGNSLDEDCDGAPACDPAAAWRTPGALRACVATTCARLVAAGTVDAAFCARLQQSLTAADGSFPEAAHRR